MTLLKGLGMSLMLGLSASLPAAVPQDRYAAWKDAHPDADAEVADLKVKTAALGAVGDKASGRMPSGAASRSSPPSGLISGARPTIWRVPGAITSIIDCAEVCPELVVVPAGSYTMGSATSESGHQTNEEPLHRVLIGQPLAVGKFAVTVGEFAGFVAATGYAVEDKCVTFDAGKPTAVPGLSWRNPGFSQGDNRPVVCINWDDAVAYINWLSRKSGKPYRLLSESEFEYVNRAGTTTTFWWGDEGNAGYANCKGCGGRWSEKFTSPVGAFSPNPFGLHDTSGNAWSWTQDCYSNSYAGAPANGAANTSGNCAIRVIRGGGWVDEPLPLIRSAARFGFNAKVRDRVVGFRVARDL